MKRILTVITLMLFTLIINAQVKKPTLMVMPSEAWCKEHGYMQKYDNQGTVEEIPDYKAAVATDKQLNGVIAKLNTLMAERGFPLKDMQQTIKSINNSATEMRLVTSKKSGANVYESPLDRLRRTAKADIILEIDWTVYTTGPKSRVSYSLRGLDAYTNKQIAGSQSNGMESFSADLPTLLAEAVQDNMDEFNEQLMAHFTDLQENGREVTLDMRVFDGANVDFEKEYNGNELNEVIDNWLSDNCVQHRFSKSDATESMILYEQVRIPLYKANGMAQDTYGFARELARYLAAAPYNIPVKTINQGLGRCLLIFGEK